MPEVTVAQARDPACRTPPTAPSLAHLYPRWPPAARRRPPAAGNDMRFTPMSSQQHECETHAAAGGTPGPRRRHQRHRTHRTHRKHRRHRLSRAGHARRTRAAAPRPAPSNLTIHRRQPVPVSQLSGGTCMCCHSPSAGTSTGSSRTHAGRWNSTPTGRSPGRPRADASTPPNPPNTRSDQAVLSASWSWSPRPPRLPARRAPSPRRPRGRDPRPACPPASTRRRLGRGPSCP